MLPEQIYLDYSQERLASYGLQPSNLKGILNARNITLPGGALEAGSKNIIVDPSGEFTKPSDIGNVIVSRAADLAIDLIVMGIYGHSRVRELVVRGVSRTLLASMTVPVLMSH